MYDISGWKRALLWPLGLLVRLWSATIRIDSTPSELAMFGDSTQASAFVLWHNRLFLVAEIARRYRKGKPVHGLVSASRDGAWLAAFFSLIGIGAIRGSSSRLGREAVTLLVEALRKGQDIGITPDGPRGPCYDFKEGAIVVVRRGRADLILVGLEFAAAWRLRSWDRFILPKPFSRVRLRCERYSRDALEAEAPGTWRARLLALNRDPTTEKNAGFGRDH